MSETQCLTQKGVVREPVNNRKKVDVAVQKNISEVKNIITRSCPLRLMSVTKYVNKTRSRHFCSGSLIQTQ